ncbi:prolyl aminopeptidase [Rhodobacteraceae bacterium 2376]|uniref:Proline iminopeptidase n=1 Tax=Rhabdonatronobacter sediminivivens TaxID=2743469 RepID=A0A7Z0HZL8_9RHOB|nr:prolyl aminopeptidase [Rhabdonatronobacter sediminivivens]NYS25211.1 prolyl aminopeptidase [Rhabdonatronobacter sediminivivens]
MDKSSGQNSAAGMLYPLTDPFDQRMLDVGDGHSIYVEQCGNPRGAPVVVFHGGPGGGCSPAMRRYFDPGHYRVVLFDQRGCGRSRPHASVTANTTWHLVQDAEAIRQTLRIDRWMVFGGSWGATLGLAYAQTHPDRVAHLVLRGVFLGRATELEWFYGGGAGRFFPDLWARFAEMIPEDERGNLIAAYNRRLFCGDIRTETRFARAWAGWENALASIETRSLTGAEGPAEYARAFARLENHYFSNNCFFEEDGQLLNNAARLADVPGTIVQGRYDMICPPVAAWNLHRAWPGSQMNLVPLAGHALSEPGITAELVRVTNGLRAEMSAG